MSEQTAGWWKLSEGLTGICDPDGRLLAEVELDENRPWAEILANARLMVAAPQLLAALEPLVTFFEREKPHLYELPDDFPLFGLPPPDEAKITVGDIRLAREAIDAAKGQA